MNSELGLGILDESELPWFGFGYELVVNEFGFEVLIAGNGGDGLGL